MSDTIQREKPRDEAPRFVSPHLSSDHEHEHDTYRGGVPIRCQFCIGQNFRRSRLRSDDLRSLILMRYPVRCTRCGQRQTVSFTIAGISLAAGTKPQRRHRSAQENISAKRTTEKL